MATEESSSNSAASNSSSVDSYLGSVISLTSKSEIRYEGVLVSINPNESTISLQNVKSYGTEGRRKEGPQVPPSEKVYEFILFRGTDIKDLQVKSTPSVPPKQHISKDPAIIQSQYAYAPPTIVSPATSVGAVAHTGPGQQFSGPGQQFSGPGQQSSGPGQQSSGPGQQSSGPGQQFSGPGQQSSGPGQQFSGPGQQFSGPGQQSSGPGQQFSGPGQQSSGPGQQFPGPGQQFPGSDPGPGQQSQLYQTGFQYGSGAPSPLPNVNGSMLSQGYIGASSNQPNIAQSISFNPQLVNSQYPSQLQNFPENANYPVFPSQPSNPYNNMSTLLSRNTPLASSLPSHVQTMPTLTSYNQELNNMNFSSSKTGPPDTSFLHGSSVPLSSLAATSSINMSPMLRPEQLTNVIPPAVTSYIHQQYTDSRNMGLLPPSMNTQSATSGMPQEPLLPLPMQAEHGVTQQFNDEFDFTAMNEKFNKDEVWGSLGKNKQEYNSGYGSENHSNHYNTEASDGSLQDSTNTGNKPVYKKDDFFDTISCNRGGWNGQNRMHDRRRLDTETFGEYQERPPMGRGNYGGSHSGYYRGSYNRGRGYGYYGGRGSRGGYRPDY